MDIKCINKKVYDALDATVLSLYNHPIAHYITKTRKREIVDVRNMVIFIYARETEYSPTSIGRIFGKDHATVLHIMRQVKTLCETNAQYREEFNILNSQFSKIIGQ